jgi:signal recognition particle receptor subunit beta
MAKKLNYLQDALCGCRNATKQGYEDAEAILDELKASIDSASASLTSTLEGLRANHLRDNKFVDKVEEQVQTFTEGFRSIHQKVEREVNEKYSSTKSFTITLFGRTKAGKSTLREILTHGDGSTIGKGGQRTTTDVHRYEWNGMTVIDVPGIEAFNGQADEELALKNAIPADLILFLITSGSPRKKEAEWLCRLKRMDKPIICICNAKQDIGDEEDPEGIRMRRFLRDPLAFLKQIHIDEVLQQFNEFVQDYLPGEHLNIIVVHLLSRFLADQPQYAEKREELVKASQFPALEKRITDEVIANAILYRKRCYLSLIDAPLFSAMGELFITSENNYYLYKLLEEKQSSYEVWKTKTGWKKKDVLWGIVNDVYRNLERAIPTFIEEHMGEEDFGEQWDKKVKNAKIGIKLNGKLKALFEDYARQIEDFFKDFQTEAVSIGAKGLRTPSISSNVGFDWKKALKLSGSGLGMAGALVCWALGWTNPVGWALIGVGTALGLSSNLTKSVERKRQKERERLSGILYDWLNKTKDSHFQELEKWYFKNISMGLIREATNRFKSTGQYLLGLANSQRSLACNLAERHCKVSRRMIDNILEDLQQDYLKDTIAQVARIPGHRTLILTTSEEQLPLGDISRKLGSKEQIDAVRIRILSYPEERCLALFKHYFKARVQPLLKTVGDSQTIAYVPKEEYSDDDIKKMQLIQQATRIHIIISYEGNQD